MHLVTQFYSRVAVWAAMLLALILLAGILSGAPILPWVFHSQWLTLLPLAAFPAGIGVSRNVLVSERRPAAGPIVALTVAAVVLGIVVLFIAGFLAPAISRSAAQAAGTEAPGDPLLLTLPALADSLHAAVQRASLEAGEPTVSRWLAANRMAWILYGRLGLPLSALVLTWLGVLSGFWSSWSTRPELRQAQRWAIGLFLILSTYGFSENSYELIAMRAAGPVFFTGWMPLLVPVLVLLGLVWPTWLVLWKRRAAP